MNTNTESQNSNPFIKTIPTTDPTAALQFCQGLAEFVATYPLSTNAHPVFNQASNQDQLAAVVPPELSIVVPVFNEAENLPELFARLTNVLQQTGLTYEIIFVDDGSRDASVTLLQQFTSDDEHVTAVELARNFGHQVAISAGLDYSRGQGVIIVDADLQDPPEVLPQFIARWQEGYDVVYAIREHRKESWLKRTCYSAFYRLLQRVTHIDIPLDAGDFCIMDRRVVDQLVNMPERNRFVRGIRSWIGLKQVGLPYERHARYAGEPKYTFNKLIYLALDGFVSFSYMPLRLISMLGLGISTFSILLAIFYAIIKLTRGLSPPGFATLIVAILFMGGMQLITIGVIGEYVGRIFEEVKQRPLYTVNRVLRRQHAHLNA